MTLCGCRVCSGWRWRGRIRSLAQWNGLPPVSLCWMTLASWMFIADQKATLVTGAYSQATIAAQLPRCSKSGATSAGCCSINSGFCRASILTVLQMVLGELVPKSLAPVSHPGRALYRPAHAVVSGDLLLVYCGAQRNRRSYSPASQDAIDRSSPHSFPGRN